MTRKSVIIFVFTKVVRKTDLVVIQQLLQTMQSEIRLVLKKFVTECTCRWYAAHTLVLGESGFAS